jgi:AraC-like DNA-binding protein
MQMFSTRGLPVPRKLPYWNALSSETFARMEVRPRDPARFDGELLRESLGSLTLLDVRSSAVCIRHTQAHVRRASAPSYLLLAPLSGNIQISIENEAAQLVRRGELCLIDHARPYEIEHGDNMRTLCIDIPREHLEAVLTNAACTVGQPLRATNGAARVLASAVRAIAAEIAPGVHAASFVPAFGSGLLGFITAAVTRSEDASARPSSCERASAVLARIDAHLDDPELQPHTIAQEFGFSTRRLRAVLAARGESFSSYVRTRRLERCAERLRDAAWANHSILSIALSAGFNNATHFGHAFREQFGVTPREWRVHHRA